MDFFNVSDPLPVVLFGLSTIICSILLFEFISYLRRIVPKSVECWFCKYKTEVNYSIRNSWTCPSCEQYNGFTKDGAYNKLIASQHNESLNLLTVARQIPKNEWKKSVSLCNKCNLKQELKVHQLASFVPMSEKNYDKEIEHFREQIEKNYELCENCETLVTKVLQNLREELSLPKKLYSVLSQVKIRGERAIYINIFLSSVLAVSSILEKISLPTEVTVYINDLQKYIDIFYSYPFFIKFLNYWIQFIIASGVFVNSIGFYQTKSAIVLINSCSWVLMFFLTLYPVQYEDYVSILKVIFCVISVTTSAVIIVRNHKQSSKKKKTLWERKEKRNTQLPTTPTSHTSFPNISRCPSNSNLSMNSFRYSPKVINHMATEENINSRINGSARSSPKAKSISPIDEVQSNINFGISNLNLGQRCRKDMKQHSTKSLLTPPKFNPFSGTRSYMSTTDKNDLWKPSTSYPFNQYEPSVSPSIFDGYEPSIATITSFGCPQACYPCPPTLAYYFSAQNFPKPSIMHTSTPFDVDQEVKSRKWTIFYSLPVIFLIGCNIFLLCIVYNKETASHQT